MPRSWSREEQPDLANDRILDAAEKVFIEQGISAAGMAEIADAAGCSRGTLYRYFPTRHELHLAYVQRAARDIIARVSQSVADVQDPHKRLTEYILRSVREVRKNPGTAAWFVFGEDGIGARMSRAPEIVETLTAAVSSVRLGLPDSSKSTGLRTRWVVRVIVSLLSDPATSAIEERSQVERFVVPSLMRD